MAGDTYLYVNPYHHDKTTKHGESNWSWVKLWQEVYGRPVPLCCPCQGGGEGGEKKEKRKQQEDFPHPLRSAVGAHVKLKKAGSGNHRTVPAIIPACSSCNRGGKKFEWNADAILLRSTEREPVFFGKLFLHEKQKGPYWTKVHSVKWTTFEGKKLTGVQGEVTLIIDKKTYTKRVGVPAEVATTRQGNLRRLERYYLGTDIFASSTVKLNNITGNKRGVVGSPNFVSPLKDWYEHEWWWYEDDTGFVYDLLRGANDDKKPIVCVADKVGTEFNKEKVIKMVQRVSVRQKSGLFTLKRSPEGKKMPSVIEQLVHSMRCLAIDHEQSMDDILQFAFQQIRNENETRTLTQ